MLPALPTRPLLAILTLLCCAPRGAPAQDTPQPPLTVASFNIRYGAAKERDPRDNWPNRKQHVVTTIRGWDAQVLGVQEALHFQVEFLRERLPGMGFVGQGRDGGERGEYAGIFYDRERLELIEHGDFWLSPTPEVVASVGWDAALTRMVTWAVFADRLAGGRRFKVWNTHFDHRGREARRNSGKLIASRIRESELPDIVLGDLNSIEESTALDMLRDAGLRDTFRDVFPYRADGGTWSGWTGPREGEPPPSRKIDYALVDDGFLTVSAGIDRRTFDGRAPSDHYPVTASLRFAPDGPGGTAIDLGDDEMLLAVRPLLIAHRGGVVAEGSPECSMAAILAASPAGFAMVELDLQRSKDGIPIVFHDRDLASACGRDGRVAELSAAELVDVRYAHSDEPILTLAGALQACWRVGLGVMLDLKAGRDDPAFLRRIDRLIVDRGMQGCAVSFSATPAIREHLKQVMLTPTAAQLAMLDGDEPPDLGGTIWFGLPQDLPGERVAQLQSAGARVFPAINTFRYPSDRHRELARRDIERLVEAGVDGLQIDSIYTDLVPRD